MTSKARTMKSSSISLTGRANHHALGSGSLILREYSIDFAMPSTYVHEYEYRRLLHGGPVKWIATNDIVSYGDTGRRRPALCRMCLDPLPLSADLYKGIHDRPVIRLG